ncbi:leucine-rich PPR motif-containing protein, mitochondrial-like isoform X2 [Vespa mandarinia]|uniref:leucine-rich PPR motif-containing protein, mitochondrial-like isoform X2 n=1 Tax=Vespa mandarinia TaxID=7446 RepID=UPI0016155CDB|nr:leucine-rich PPR motif-containing protein, mitochondrial-like isoform X2 [Vespa mandarinia]
MALFFNSTKYFRYLRNISKRIQINNSYKNFLCLEHKELTLQERNFANQQTKSSDIDNIIKKIDNKYQHEGIIDKHLIEDIINCIQIEGKLESSQALLTLRCCNVLIQCTQEQRIKFANTLWKLCNIYNVPMNVTLYNALLQVYIENNYTFSPLNILSDMKKQSIQPNKVTYMKLLEYFCKNGNITKAKIVCQCLKDEKLLLDIDIFNLLIIGYSQIGDLNSAINVLNVIRKINLLPSNETYIALMCAFAKFNDIESIREILFKCQKKNVNFTNENILNVIYTLIVNRNVDHVDEMLWILKKPYYTEGIHFFGKIIDIKQEDIAIKILFYMYPYIKNNFCKNEYETFFINKFICSNVIPGKIVDICSHFYMKFGNTKIFTEAIYISFKHDNDLLALRLLKEWKNNGHKLRPHYFWPFLVKAQNNHDIKGLLKYMKDMINVYDVEPCINTIANFIIPNLLGVDSSYSSLLKEYGIPEETIRNATVYYLLQNNKTKSSYMYVLKYPTYYSDFILGNSLRQALFNTYDIDSYLEIVRHLYIETNTGRKEKVSLTDKIYDIIDFLHENPTCISKMRSMTQMENEQSQTKNSMSKQLHSFTFCDPTMLYKLFLRSKGWNTSIPHEIYIFIVDQLLKQYTNEESKMILKKLINEYRIGATCKLSLTYAQNLISLGNLDDAAEIIEYTGKVIKIRSKIIDDYTKSLLNEAALMGDDRIVKRFYDILLNIHYVKLSQNFLDPLVIIHIEQGNIIKALEIAETLSEKYKHIPALRELLESIVLTKDVELLQYFINVATKTYNEQYILMELILCFLKNDYEEEAKRIIKIFCTSNYKFTIIQESLQNSFKERNIKILEKLLDLSVDYPDTDRFVIYEYLVTIYAIKGDYKCGLNLWRRMQKEKVLLTDNSITYFNKLFRESNLNLLSISNSN